MSEQIHEVRLHVNGVAHDIAFQPIPRETLSAAIRRSRPITRPAMSAQTMTRAST